MDIGYDPAGHGSINRYGVHAGARTVAERFDPANDVFTYPAKPAFQADLTSDPPKLLPSGQTVAIVFDTSQFDQGHNYDPSTGRFTAPVDGVYQFETTVSLGGLDPEGRDCDLSVVTSSHTYHYDPGRLSPNPRGRADLHFSVLTPMKAGEIAAVTIDLHSGRGLISVRGGVLRDPVTTFSGFLVG